MIPILLYHGISVDAPDSIAPFTLHPDLFADHMALLQKRGHRTTTVSEHVAQLARGETPPEGTVLVTFDDGFVDFASHAWPVMRELGIAATMYVVTGAIGQRASWLGSDPGIPTILEPDELRRLDQEGCELGAHSVSHPHLDTLPRSDLSQEVACSRRDLSALLGHPIRSFAYPHGYHDRRVVEQVQAAGFTSACAVRNMLSSADDEPFSLARVTIGASCSTDDLARILDGEGLAVAPHPELIRTRCWRVYRRTRRLALRQ